MGKIDVHQDYIPVDEDAARLISGIALKRLKRVDTNSYSLWLQNREGPEAFLEELASDFNQGVRQMIGKPLDDIDGDSIQLSIPHFGGPQFQISVPRTLVRQKNSARRPL